MKTAKLTFHRLVNGPQEYGSDDEHLTSKVFFSMELDGKALNLHAYAKQAVGSNFERDSFEVSKPQGYDGPFNHEQFQKAVEQYMRMWVGRSSRGGVHIGPGASNVKIGGADLAGDWSTTIDLPDGATAW